MAKLEAHLRAAKRGPVVDDGDSDGGLDDVHAIWASKSSSPEKPLTPPRQQTPPWSAARPDPGSSSKLFSQLPPSPVLKSLVDVYFANCHNQPYCFFHESSLRRRLAAGQLPHYLLLALAATAVRYSTNDYFKDRQLEAAEALSRAAWIIILDQVFATDHSPNVAAAQGTSLLAIIDFTGMEYPRFPVILTPCRCMPDFYIAGHHRLGWVKIGLAIRLVQSLKLNAEPDSALPPWQQEEHRRVFWSVYLLDKFVSCGRSRPPAILDLDCTLSLPCSEEAFRMETPEKTPTLAVFQDLPSSAPVIRQLDHFAILVLMCSMLGLAVRDTFQQKPVALPAWDCRSDFAKIGSIIMSFESMHATSADGLGAYIADRFGTYEGFDRQRVGHFIWARGVYHLCGCMLYHPVNMHRHRQTHGADFPATFTRECLGRCQEHAAQLTNILQTLQTMGCCARGSFLGYLAACAASIHQLYIYSPNQDVAARAVASSGTCLGVLEQGPVCWPNHNLMAAALKDLDTDPRLARLLIDPSQVVVDAEADAAQIDGLWQVIDYGVLSDSKRKSPGLLPAFPSSLGPGMDWAFFEDQISNSRNSFLGLALPDLITEL